MLQTKAILEDQFDPTRAQETQRSAHALNSRVLRPVQGVVHRRIDGPALSQGERVLEWMGHLSDSRAIPAAYAELLERLAFGVEADGFEHCMESLGNALGYRADRPEKTTGSGPDCLWFTGETFLVIECKNCVKTSRDAISKSEAAQLGSSASWFETNYPDRQATPVLVHPTDKLKADAFPPTGTMVLDRDGLLKLRSAVTDFATALAQSSAEAWTPGDIVSLLRAHQLNAASSLMQFLSVPRRDRA
jgi:hypothetical protein